MVHEKLIREWLEKALEEWLTCIIRERIELEEGAFVEAKRQMAAKGR